MIVVEVTDVVVALSEIELKPPKFDVSSGIQTERTVDWKVHVCEGQQVRKLVPPHFENAPAQSNGGSIIGVPVGPGVEVGVGLFTLVVAPLQ